MEKKIKKRILIISPFFPPNLGGAETHLNDLCEYLSKNNFFVYVFTYQPLTTKAKGSSLEKKKNLEIHRINWFGENLFHKFELYPWLEFLYLFPRLFLAVFAFMIKNHQKVDVIHAHGLIAAAITRIIILFYAKKTVMTIHAIYGFKKRKLMAKAGKWILSDFETILSLGESSKKDLIAAGLAKEKIKIHHQWVNQSLFKPKDKNKCRERLNLKGDFLVLFVGRLIEKKGVKILMETAKALPKIKFVFVGDGPMYAQLKKIEKKENNIYAAGRKTQEQTAFYYGASDILVIPSQYEEGFARVVLESLCCGRPVIAANRGCLPEMLTSEVAIFVEPEEQELKKAIFGLYKNPGKLKELSQNSRAYGEKYFSEKNAEEISAVYF